MRTRGLVYCSAEMIAELKQDQSLQQVANVATLPGIVGSSLAMPDIHWGYGFPIGGVAAFDLAEGVVSPGGVGYDINCGVRLLRTNLSRSDIAGRVQELVDVLFYNIPSGVGSRRRDLKLNTAALHEVLRQGAAWAVKNGFGDSADLQHIEAGGTIPGANPELVSEHALDRGRDQLGTLGSGNHFTEIGYVEKLYDEPLARGCWAFSKIRSPSLCIPVPEVWDIRSATTLSANFFGLRLNMVLNCRIGSCAAPRCGLTKARNIWELWLLPPILPLPTAR